MNLYDVPLFELELELENLLNDDYDDYYKSDRIDTLRTVIKNRKK